MSAPMERRNRDAAIFARALAFYNPCPQVAGAVWDVDAIFNGSEGIGRALRDVCGASFNHVDDATCDEFRSQMTSFISRCRRMRPKVAYVYICTHGILDQASKELHLMMDDSINPAKSMDGFLQSSISGEELRKYIEQLREANAEGKVVVLLDCCHAGALYPPTLGSPYGFVNVRTNQEVRSCVEEGSGTLVLLSCQAHEVSYVDTTSASESNRSPNFSRAVAATLKEFPNVPIDVNVLIPGVVDKVRQWSSGRQNPIYQCYPESELFGNIGIYSVDVGQR